MTQQDASSMGTSGQEGLPVSGNAIAIVGAARVKQLLIEPLSPADNGECIAQAIRNAQNSVWLEVFSLTHSNVIEALKQAATPDPTTGQKKDVRVILEPRAYTSSSKIAYIDLKQQLTNAGVLVQQNATHLGWGGETHAKIMVIDGQIAYIMTANLTEYALGSTYSGQARPAGNREYILIDEDQQRVNTLMTLFRTDWGDPAVPHFDPALLQSSALVVSPNFGGSKKNVVGNALAVLTQLIKSAQHTLQIEMEEIHENYPTIEQQLVNAAAQQVTVQVILPDKPTQGKMTTRNDIAFLTKSGIQVQYSSPSTPIMHAKMILVDPLLENGQVVSGSAFVGSQNLTTAAIENNREVGLVISDPKMLNQLWQTFQQDWGDSQSTPGQW